MNNKIMYFLSHFMLIGIGFSYILKCTYTNFIVSMIIGYIFGILLIYISNKLKLNKKSYICNYIFLIISGIIIVNFCHTLYLDNTSLLSISILTLVISFIISNISKDAKLKSYQILFIISIALFITKTTSLINTIDMENYLPLIPNLNNILYGAICYSLYTSVPIITTSYNSNIRNSLIYYSLGCFTSIIISIITVGVLGIGESIIYRYPEYVVLRRIMFTEYVSNVENIFSFAIIIDLVISISHFLSNIKTKNRIIDLTNLLICIYVIYNITNNNSLLMLLFNNSVILCTIILLIYVFECIIGNKIHILNIGEKE